MTNSVRKVAKLYKVSVCLKDRLKLLFSYIYRQNYINNINVPDVLEVAESDACKASTENKKSITSDD